MRQSIISVLTVCFFVSTCTNLSASDLISFGSDWQYLQILDGLAGDPSLTDPNFIEAWYEPDYDTTSPIPWAGPSPAPFAYGNSDQLGNPNVEHIDAFNPALPGFQREAQTLLPQPNSGDRYTTYFRREFTTTADATDLAMEFLVDDGARIYIDGREVFSYRCCQQAPGGTPAGYRDLATAVASEGYVIGQLGAGEVLPAGDHVMAIAVHQANPVSSDMGMSMRFFDGFVLEQYVDTGEVWNYFEGTQEPSGGSLDWTTPAYDDADWEFGEEGFGFEAGNDPNNSVAPLLGTPIEGMHEMYTALYLRKEFDVPDASVIENLFLTIDYDDAFFAYVNGHLVASSVADPDGDPLTGIPFDTPAIDILPPGQQHESSNGRGPGESYFIDLSELPPGILNSGPDNILAIHGLNYAPASSDFVLAQMSLLGIGERNATQSVSGDFDSDGDLDAADINALSEAIRNGNMDGRFDLNSDSMVDAEDRRVWVEELRQTYFGDSNMDGEFNTRDFVFVFVNGEYEDNIPNNSTWEDGDWNGDGDFTTNDFVVAFGGAGFEAGPRAAAAATIPEPSSCVLIMIGLLCFSANLRKKS